ncbi:MAG TPA: GNAT family N-acetyltransferase [Gemmatimonadales bacterium]|nr:GNAT family N-acetyltransferase [Gemmatimonadales bacterium]
MTDVRTVSRHDADAWLKLRRELWPDESARDHELAVREYFTGPRGVPREVLVAVDLDGNVVGFAELSIRNVVDNCTTDRVAYLEGWCVAPTSRRRGIGRVLIEEAERWAVRQGCTEFGSDTNLDNPAAAAAHRALGFIESGQVRNFRKDIG